MKFNKVFKLLIQKPFPDFQDYILIEPPMTIEFSVERHNRADANSANIKVMNLSEKTRQLIFRDRYQIWDPTSEIGWLNSTAPDGTKSAFLNSPRNVQLYAGYEHEADELSLIFNGQMNVGHSTRRGPDWITEMECQDPGIYQYVVRSNLTMKKNATKAEIIQALYQNFARVNWGQNLEGLISNKYDDLKGTGERGIVLFGKTMKLVIDQAKDAGRDSNFYFDNGRPFAKMRGETFGNPALTVINSATGLLNVPVRSGAQTTIQMLFTPQLQIGQRLSVVAREKVYNGEYEVIGIRHSGVISGTHDLQSMTVVSLDNGALIKEVQDWNRTHGG